MDASCIFCKIASGEFPSEIVYQDEMVVAFRDINPQAPVHIQVIPREHIVNAAALTEEHGELIARLMLAATQVARDLGVESSGYRLVANVGRDGGQSVAHLHLHVLGGRGMGWPPG